MMETKIITFTTVGTLMGNSMPLNSPAGLDEYLMNESNKGFKIKSVSTAADNGVLFITIVLEK